ncbi:MAG TPA: glycosyltransferase, partial [Clostridia bacterium]|nr:glycosyltransferase [Clostridia bacterium]
MKKSLLNVILIARRNTTLNTLQALDSIVNQSYSPIEILVVDANEPDSLYSLGLQEDLLAYPDIDCLKVDCCLSTAEIRNHILEHIDGEYTAFLRSNDVWEPTKAFTHIEIMEEEPEMAASCSDGLLIDKRKGKNSVANIIKNSASYPSRWTLDNPAKMSAQVIYRTKIIREIGGFDDRFINFCDGDMLLRLSKSKEVSILPVLLCKRTLTTKDEDYELHNFMDNQRIFYKYRDLFLLDKSMTINYYKNMLYLAKLNYLWLSYIIYLFFYFVKA